MNDDGKAVSKVVTIARGADPPRQFVLHLGEALVFGRAADCDVVLPHRGISGRHAALRYRLSKDSDPKPELCVEDTSTNGTGASAGRGETWGPLRKGESRVLETALQILLPFNCKVQEEASLVTIIFHGDGLPDAYDERRQSGRWLYQGKLGEGALGIVHKAADVSGKLGDAVAIKVSKVAKGAKPTSKLRNAFILHREAQWSLQRLHNSDYTSYCVDKAALFVRYLEDHTGQWTENLDFDEERSLFESADFRWDKFRPPKPMPAHPYVAMEFVPGRTLHAALGWIKDNRSEALLTGEERFAILKESAEALQYLTSLGLIHRDFRTTNIMVSGSGTETHVRIIDLGHTILAEQHQLRNKSAVVRCNWKEEEKKRFDWAPPEVKAKENFVNFAYPHHSFDVFSFGVLAVQMQSNSLQDSRTQVDYLSGMQEGACIESAVGLDQDFLKLMLGQPTSRPSVEQIAQRLRQSKRKATEELQRPSKRQAVEKGLNGSAARSATAEGELSESLQEPTSVVEEELRQAAEASPEDREKAPEKVARSAPGPEKDEQRKRAKIERSESAALEQTQPQLSQQHQEQPDEPDAQKPEMRKPEEDMQPESKQPKTHEPTAEQMQSDVNEPTAMQDQPELSEQITIQVQAELNNQIAMQEQQGVEEQTVLHEQLVLAQPVQPDAPETQAVEMILPLGSDPPAEQPVAEQTARDLDLQQQLQFQMQQLRSHALQQQLIAQSQYLRMVQLSNSAPVAPHEMPRENAADDPQKEDFINKVAWNKQSRPPQPPEQLQLLAPRPQPQPQMTRPVLPLRGILPFGAPVLPLGMPTLRAPTAFPARGAPNPLLMAMALGTPRPRPAMGFSRPRPAMGLFIPRPMLPSGTLSPYLLQQLVRAQAQRGNLLSTRPRA